ncbi:MAG: class I SAM-dependent methyltransferase [Bacillota bacterium]
MSQTTRPPESNRRPDLERVRRRYDLWARLFEGQAPKRPERAAATRQETAFDRWRRGLWSQAAGQVLELGVGAGANMPHYPAGASITAVDLSPGMLSKAAERADRERVPVRLIEANVEELPFADASFDTVVASFVFCTVPDPHRGLAEAARVCRPGGRVLLLEHMQSPRPLAAALIRALDPLLYLAAGDHPARRTGTFLGPAGLEVVRARDLWHGIVWEVTAKPGPVSPPAPWPRWWPDGDGNGRGGGGGGDGNAGDGGGASHGHR